MFFVEASLLDITLGYGFDLPQGPNKQAAYGATKFSDFGFSYFGTAVGARASFTTLQGLTQSAATGKTAADLAVDPSGKRPDVKLTSASADLWVALYRHNLDLNELVNAALPLRGSGFNVVGVASYDDLGVSMRQPLNLPVYDYGDDRNFVGGRFRSVSVSVGPAGLLARQSFYAAGLLALGGGEQILKYTVRSPSGAAEVDETVSLRGRPSKTIVYLAIGYRGKKAFTALDATLETPSYVLRSIELQTSRGSIALTLGDRF